MNASFQQNFKKKIKRLAFWHFFLFIFYFKKKHSKINYLLKRNIETNFKNMKKGAKG
jgi:hypothetical protein